MSLYRTHRPQKWEDLISQPHVSKTITQELKSGNVAHAFLFCGPRGVGKTTSARLLGKSLNCANRKKDDFEPCGECESCASIAAARAVDVIEIDAASHTGVDNVRENIIENARFMPTSSKYKVFIIDEAHMLSTSAFNALLKTLEEPPAHAIFIMATTEIHKVPATIISRCQRFDFKHISNEDIRLRLKQIAKKENVEVDDSVLEHVAWRAQGSMRDAESLLGQILSIQHDGKITEEIAEQVLPSRKSKSLIDYIEQSLNGNTKNAIEILHSIVESGVNIPHLIDDLIDIARSILLIQATNSHGTSYFNKNDLEKLKELAKARSQNTIVQTLEIFIKRRAEIGLSPIMHLPLELATIEISLLNPYAPIEEKKNDDSKNEPEQITSSEQINQAEIEEKNEISNSNNIRIDIGAINAKWNNFLEHIHTYNHSLPFILKTCKLIGVQNSSIIVSLPYEFHKKRIEEPLVQQTIRKALKDIYNVELDLTAQVDESQANDSDKVVAEVINTFGGAEVN